MATTTQNGGNALPPKPWEREGSSSRQAPFKPSSPGKTSDVVEASGTTRPGETVFNSDRSNSVNTNAPVRPLPTRPWENNYGRSSYGGMYNSYGGGVGGMYGGGMYGRGIYGGGMYNRGGYGGHYGSGMYGGGGMYNNGFGGPYGVQDSNDPHGEPTSPPRVWISFLRVMQGMVNFFGRISILIDQNTQAFHMLMSALLQLFDRSGMLYGELARFVLGVMGVKAKTKKAPPTDPNGLLSPGQHAQADQRCIEEAKPATSGSWDNVWGNEASR